MFAEVFPTKSVDCSKLYVQKVLILTCTLFSFESNNLPSSLSFQDVYFDDESAEVVISSLRLGEEPDG
jgi:hypothetical protein